MNRRSFLSLLVAAPFVPALAKLEAVGDVFAPLASVPELVPLVETSPLLVSRYCLSLVSETLRVGGVGRIAVMAQRRFRPDRLLVSGASLDFDLLHVSAAGEPQLDQCMPAALFAPTQYGTPIGFAHVEPGEQIVLAVVNRGSKPAEFRAAFMGSALG